MPTGGAGHRERDPRPAVLDPHGAGGRRLEPLPDIDIDIDINTDVYIDIGTDIDRYTDADIDIDYIRLPKFRGSYYLGVYIRSPDSWVPQTTPVYTTPQGSPLVKLL